MDKVFPIFVDNINQAVKTHDLRKLFSRAGDVKEVTIISHHGFVTFGNPDDAVRAIEKFNYYHFYGKKLKVEASKELDDFLEKRKRSFSQQIQRRKSFDHHHQGAQNYHHQRHHRNYNSDYKKDEHFRSRSRSDDERHPVKRRIRIDSSASNSSHSHHADLRNVLESKKAKFDNHESKIMPNLDDFKVEFKRRDGHHHKRERYKRESEDRERYNRESEDEKYDENEGKSDRSYNSAKSYKSEKSNKSEKSYKSDRSEKNEADESMEDNEEKEDTEEKGEEQELYIGNLFKPVEVSDLEQLLDVYGVVNNIEMFSNHAIARLECSYEAAQEAIESLDHSHWMDNAIRCIQICVAG